MNEIYTFGIAMSDIMNEKIEVINKFFGERRTSRIFT